MSSELIVTIEENGRKAVGVNHHGTNFEFHLSMPDAPTMHYIRHLDQDEKNSIDDLFRDTKRYFDAIDAHLSPEGMYGPKKNGSLWLSTKTLEELPKHLKYDLESRWDKKSEYTYSFSGWYWSDRIDECFEWSTHLKKLKFGDYTFSVTEAQKRN